MRFIDAQVVPVSKRLEVMPNWKLDFSPYPLFQFETFNSVILKALFWPKDLRRRLGLNCRCVAFLRCAVGCMAEKPTGGV